jgi:vacuolar protein sorting-associated protein 13A/C
MTVEEVETRTQSLKQKRIKSAEETFTTKPTEKNSAGNSGFVNQLINKIIDKIQITIKNIHICYEDNISDPDHPCSVGITLKELSVLSDNNKTQEPKEISNVINKVQRLRNYTFLDNY